MHAHCVALTGEAVVHLHGNDIGRFLQGQLTCDLRKLAADRAVAGAMCTVQGRVISDVWVVQVDESHCLLRLRRSLATHFAENLERYARFSRIVVAVDPRRDPIVGACGDLSSGDPALPGDIGACSAAGSIICLRTGLRTAEWISTDADGPGPTAPAGCAPGAGSEWEAEQLLAGHYALEEGDSGMFTPQALNYDVTGRVAFDKGCYTGQEVVARLHYKGQSKRRLRTGVISGNGGPAPGDRLLDAAGDDVGDVLRAVMDSRGRVVIAGMVRASHGDAPLLLADGRSVAPPNEA